MWAHIPSFIFVLSLAGDLDLKSSNLITCMIDDWASVSNGRCWTAGALHHNAFCFAYGLVTMSASQLDQQDQIGTAAASLFRSRLLLKNRYFGADWDLMCTLPLTTASHTLLHLISLSRSLLCHLSLPRGLTCLTGLTLYIRPRCRCCYNLNFWKHCFWQSAILHTGSALLW